MSNYDFPWSDLTGGQVGGRSPAASGWSTCGDGPTSSYRRARRRVPGLQQPEAHELDNLDEGELMLMHWHFRLVIGSASWGRESPSWYSQVPAFVARRQVQG